MIQAYKGVYAGAWRYMLACPLLFAVPVVVEFIQHVIEMRIGMYDSVAAAQAVESHGGRLAWGVVKTLALSVAVYWVARFLAFGPARAGRLEAGAVRLYVPVLLWGLFWTAAFLWGGAAMRTVGLGDHAVAAGASVAAATFVLGVLLAPWRIGAALGNARLGFFRSIGLVGWRVWWGLVFTLVAVLPPMAVHYGLSFLAMGATEGAAWAVLAADALVVGYLGAVIAATDFAIARDAVERAGEGLAPAPADLASPLARN